MSRYGRWTTDDAADAFREANGGWGGLSLAGRSAEARPAPDFTREDLAYTQACPSCGAPAHVPCRGVVAANAVHAWRFVVGAVRS